MFKTSVNVSILVYAVLMYVLLSNTIPMLITVISHHSNNITSKCTVGTEVVCVCDLLGQREGKGRERERGKRSEESLVVCCLVLFIVFFFI